MNKAQALHAFWSSFEWPAIDEQSAYDENTLEALNISNRYISYEVGTANIDGGAIPLSASLWHRSTSWADVSTKADEISAAIGYAGTVKDIDGGKLWITQRAPFAQRASDGNNNDWRRMILSISAEFLTAS